HPRGSGPRPGGDGRRGPPADPPRAARQPQQPHGHLRASREPGGVPAGGPRARHRRPGRGLLRVRHRRGLPGLPAHAPPARAPRHPAHLLQGLRPRGVAGGVRDRARSDPRLRQPPARPLQRRCAEPGGRHRGPGGHGAPRGERAAEHGTAALAHGAPGGARLRGDAEPGELPVGGLPHVGRRAVRSPVDGGGHPAAHRAVADELAGDRRHRAAERALHRGPRPGDAMSGRRALDRRSLLGGLGAAALGVACAKSQEVIVETAAGLRVDDARIDEDPWALLPSGAVSWWGLGARELFAAKFGPQVVALLQRTLPVPTGSGYEPGRDVDAVALGLYTFSGVDVAGIATGRFDANGFEQAATQGARTVTGRPVTRTTYAGRPLFLSDGVGLTVLTSRTMAFGNEVGIRRVLDRIE